MFDVLHPTKTQMMSYDDYLKFALVSNAIKSSDAPSARCPVCKRKMKTRAGQTKGDGHFYHDDSEFCPTKDPAQKPYLKLTPTRINADKVLANRGFASVNIEFIYTRLRSIVPCLDLQEFINILKAAKKLNVYGYANLNVSYLPYVYVTLVNFLPSTSYKQTRKLKFCFFYEAVIQSYDDLWIERGFSSELYRISYSDGSAQKVIKIETTIDYLVDPKKGLTEAQKRWCLDIL